MRNEYTRPQMKISSFSKECVMTASDTAQKLTAQAKAEKAFANASITEFVSVDW